MRQILLFAALAASLALLIGCGAAKDKPEAAKDMPDKAAYHNLFSIDRQQILQSHDRRVSCGQVLHSNAVYRIPRPNQRLCLRD